MKKKNVRIVLLAAALLLAGFLIWRNYFRPKSRVIQVSGNIEATTVDFSFKIPGRMVRRLVDEGDIVKKGQVIAVLDKVQLQEAVEEQKANVKEAEWALRELLNGSRPEDIAQARANEQHTRWAYVEMLNGSRPEDISQARAAARQALVERIRAQREYNREKQLFKEGYIPALTYDNEKASYRSAAQAYSQAREHYLEVKRGPRVEDIEQARQAWNQAEWNLRELVKGPRVEDIEQARARLKSAQNALAQAQRSVYDSTLYSPIDGIVLSKNAEDGEYVSAGTPVVTAADLSSVWLRAYVDETDLARVKYNAPANVTTDTYPGKVYHGRVAFISSQAEFTPKEVQTFEERVQLVYRIKIDLDNPGFELKPGMPADAVFQ